MKFGVLGILCHIFIAYTIANHLNVNFSVLINGFGKRAPIFLLSVSRNYVVSVRRGFFFLLVLGQVVLFYFGPPWAFHIIKLLRVQILGTC